MSRIKLIDGKDTEKRIEEAGRQFGCDPNVISKFISVVSLQNNKFDEETYLKQLELISTNVNGQKMVSVDMVKAFLSTAIG